jgi:hypothetical protein
MIEQMRVQRARGLISHFQVPKFIYRIEHIVAFEYGGMQHVILGFENKSVQICELVNGRATCCFEVDLKSAVTDLAKVT